MSKVILTITAEDETLSRISVSGPIGQKAVCYAMLECARDIIKDLVDRANKPLVTDMDLNSIIQASRNRD